MGTLYMLCPPPSPINIILVCAIRTLETTFALMFPLNKYYLKLICFSFPFLFAQLRFVPKTEIPSHKRGLRLSQHFKDLIIVLRCIIYFFVYPRMYNKDVKFLHDM